MGVDIHYRARKCTTCKVKLGLGTCEKCRKTKEILTAMASAVALKLEYDMEVISREQVSATATETIADDTLRH